MSTLQEIYNDINAFRQDPLAYYPSCHYNKLPLSPLHVIPELEQASFWQVTHTCTPINHNTCPEWCFMFNRSCSHIDRIKHFMFPQQTTNENEVLVKGPKRPLKHLINKSGHCDKLLSNDVNSMGGAIVNNLFILSLVWLL